MKLQVGEKLPLKELLRERMLFYLQKYLKMSREIRCTRPININTTYKIGGDYNVLARQQKGHSEYYKKCPFH